MNIIIIGSGGHAKVVKDLAEQLNHEIIAVCDPNDENKNKSNKSGSHIRFKS